MSRIFTVIVLMVMTLGARGASNAVLQDLASKHAAQAYLALEMLTQSEGADLNEYLRNVYGSTKKRWFANMPISVAKGNKGVNVVVFRILQDGTVPNEFLKMKMASGKADLDEASLAGIRTAAPFAKLPANFTAPYIELRLTFYYNLEPPR
jgi:TonB family protein